MENATSNAVGLRPMRVFGYMYRGVNKVSQPSLPARMGELEHQSGL